MANLSAVVTGAMNAVRAVATEMLPAAVPRDTDGVKAVAAKLLGDAASWFTEGRGVAAYVTLALILLAITFLGGAVWALTCRTMKGPGLGGSRVPRAVFEASPKRYYAAVRSAKKARRRGSGCGCGSGLLLTGLGVALVACLAAMVLY